MNKDFVKKLLKTLPAFFTLFLFIFTVSFLNYKGYINPVKNIREKKETPEDLSRILTDIKINNIDIKNKILFEYGNKLKIYDPFSDEENLLVKKNIVDTPGILEDGRIYFWQTPDYLYEWLYIQKGELFEKFKINLKTNDGGQNSQTPPLVSSNGEFIIFTSDRDSQDNYFRRALYKYDLETFELSQLTKNQTMTIHSVSISPDSQIIAFAYQDLKSNQPSSPTALGLIFSDSKSPNLFPKIKLNNSQLFFSSDSQYIFINAQIGPSAFQVSSAKISDSLEEGIIKTVSSDNISAITTEYKIEDINFFKNCLGQDEKNKNFGNYQVNIFKFENSKFNNISSVKAKNALINFQPQNLTQQFSPNNEDVLTTMQNNDFCQKTIGILNFHSSFVNPTNLPLDKNLIWVK